MLTIKDIIISRSIPARDKINHLIKAIENNPEIENGTLHSLIGYNDPDNKMLKYLIASGADTEERNENGRSLLFILRNRLDSRSHSSDPTILLLSNFKKYPIHSKALLFIELGFKEKLKDLIEQNKAEAKFLKNGSGDTILHCILQSSEIDFIRIPSELYNNEQNLEGNTPLHIAVMNNDLIATEILIKNNIFNNDQNDKGDTPLVIAARNLSKDGYEGNTILLDLMLDTFKMQNLNSKQNLQLDKNITRI